MPNSNDFLLTRRKYPGCRASPSSAVRPLTDCPVLLSWIFCLSLLCFTRCCWETTKNVGLETMLQSFAWTASGIPQIAFHFQCHNRHRLIRDVWTHYRLIAWMSRTFICGTNGQRFKPQQSITTLLAFTPKSMCISTLVLTYIKPRESVRIALICCESRIN